MKLVEIEEIPGFSDQQEIVLIGPERHELFTEPAYWIPDTFAYGNCTVDALRESDKGTKICLTSLREQASYDASKEVAAHFQEGDRLFCTTPYLSNYLSEEPQAVKAFRSLRKVRLGTFAGRANGFPTAGEGVDGRSF
ncbi:MAG TPA: hypothetical protein VLK82_17465 [Candidatus Tectomicrobia bacterium]|nr:hypothetical protein [Candidatus Tectomicrobia bacterium]